jgi:hypothetical protein
MLKPLSEHNISHALKGNLYPAKNSSFSGILVA